MPVAYNFGPPPPAPADHSNTAVNINDVYEPSFDYSQTWMPPNLWVAMIMVVPPLVLYLPTHFVLRRHFPARTSTLSAGKGPPE